MPELQTLPPEVLLSVSKLLNHDDRKSLSAVSANLRGIIAISLFKTLKVDCPLAKNQASFLNETVQKYGAYVVELRINVTFYPRQQKPEDTNEDTPWFWTNPPASVWARDIADVDTIRNLLLLKGLSNCQTLTVYTNGHDNFSDTDIGSEEAEWDDNDIAGTSIYFCKDPEEWEDVFLMEEEYSWRAALRDMYRDIATLSPTQDLKFLNFLPRKVSIWQETDGVWSTFLGRLKKLTLHTYGGESGGDADVTTLEGFEVFFNELSSVLFNHATELEYLEIVALANGYLGVGSLYLSHLTMPKLQEVHLGNMAINSILIPFLTDRKLKKLVIKDCSAQTTDRRGNEQPTWQDVFAAVQQSVQASAEIQIIFQKKAPLTRDESYNEDYVPPETEDESIKQLRRTVKRGEAYIWPYLEIDSKYGWAFADADMNAERLGSGDDNLEFALLANEVRRGGGSCIVESSL